ncbi:hypothetical protein CDAR_281401 [Caerostris darwini]|uniref:Uncharacterized protein n=1 Tax=Caerostris darwini TaxID=1538125 RepID=A0AAV4TDY3_9ARAC|nr:hypothetical protein CDAR_281401 [Caerostris darwini]
MAFRNGNAEIVGNGKADVNARAIIPITIICFRSLRRPLRDDPPQDRNIVFAIDSNANRTPNSSLESHLSNAATVELKALFHYLLVAVCPHSVNANRAPC